MLYQLVRTSDHLNINNYVHNLDLYFEIIWKKQHMYINHQVLRCYFEDD